MKIRIVTYFIAVALLLVGCKRKNATIGKEGVNVPAYTIDVDAVKETLDISDLFVDDLQIISLETQDSCLLSDIKKVQYAGENVYISDNAGQCVYQFSANSGKFVRSIGKRGDGPEEYSCLGDFVVDEQFLYIQDLYQDKIIRYGLYDHSVESLPTGNIVISELIDFERCLYCVSNYGSYEDGCHNLYRLDKATCQLTPLLPADAEVAKQQAAIGLSRYASKSRDVALLIYALNDTIYSVKEDNVSPLMTVTFSKRKLPDEMKYWDAMKKVDVASQYILGMNRIQHSDRYIFLDYNDKDLVKSVLLNKETGDYNVTDRFILKKWGGLYVTDFETYNDEFVILQPAYLFKNAWKAVYSRNDFETRASHERFQTLNAQLQEDDNPVLFKLKFK